MTLLERVEGAIGPDRELDALICAALNVRPDWLRGDDRKLVAGADGYVSLGKYGPGFVADHYTSSLDAVLALVETKLPGQAPFLLQKAVSAVAEDHALHMRFWQEVDGDYTHALCRALLSRILTALEAGDG